MEDWMEDHKKRKRQPREEQKSCSREKKGLMETMKRMEKKIKGWRKETPRSQNKPKREDNVDQ